MSTILPLRPSRRDVLAGGGLLVAFSFASRSLALAGGGEGGGGPQVLRPDLPGDLKIAPELDSWIHIAPDGRTTVFSGKAIRIVVNTPLDPQRSLKVTSLRLLS